MDEGIRMVGNQPPHARLRAAYSRLPFGILLTVALVGCSATTLVPTDETSINGRAISTTTYKYRDANTGRIVGTVAVTPEMLAWVGVKNLDGAVAQAFDPDGTPLNDKVTIDANGHFLMQGLKDSRPRIFVEADVNGLRFRAVLDAPRKHTDYAIVLDPGSTYLSDKLRRAALDHDVPFDKLDSQRVTQTETVVNTYMQDGQRREVLQQTNPDLNAYSFDHFMDSNAPVKIAVYDLSPAILRGWTPPLTDTVPPADLSGLPSPVPTPTPTPGPIGPTPITTAPSPTPTAIATPPK
jgi:hypothetical protein